MRSLACLLLVALPANAEVRGRVWSGDQPAARAVVLLRPEAPMAAPKIRTAHLDEVWLSFVPKVQVVPPGSTLVFRAKDADTHTVHAWYGKRTLFNKASVAHGPEESVVLDEPGVVTVTCDLHAEMRAYVIVSDAPLSAVTDIDGRFTAPEGNYRVRVWQPDQETDLGDLKLQGDVDLRVAAVQKKQPEVVVAHEQPKPEAAPQLPAWMQRLGARKAWPGGNAAYALSIVGAPIGFLLAWIMFRLGRRWSLATMVMLGCALAFVLGALSVVGLSAAVATALGFGAFMGTILVGARRLSTTD
jgi:plastocyanin